MMELPRRHATSLSGSRLAPTGQQKQASMRPLATDRHVTFQGDAEPKLKATGDSLFAVQSSLSRSHPVSTHKNNISTSQGTLFRRPKARAEPHWGI